MNGRRIYSGSSEATGTACVERAFPIVVEHLLTLGCLLIADDHSSLLDNSPRQVQALMLGCGAHFSGRYQV